jgi:hypothetical protein
MMENTIIVKGTAHKVKSFTLRDGSAGTSFSLAVYTGKAGEEYAPTLWFNVTSYDSVNVHEKQKDVIVDGYFKAEKGTDGKIYTKLIAKKVISTQSQAPKSFDDLPF